MHFVRKIIVLFLISLFTYNISCDVSNGEIFCDVNKIYNFQEVFKYSRFWQLAIVETNFNYSEFIRLQHITILDHNQTNADVILYTKIRDTVYNEEEISWGPRYSWENYNYSRDAAVPGKFIGKPIKFYSVKCPGAKLKKLFWLTCKYADYFSYIIDTDYKNWFRVKKCTEYEYFIHTYINADLMIDEKNKIQEEISPKENYFKINLTETAQWIDKCNIPMGKKKSNDRENLCDKRINLQHFKQIFGNSSIWQLAMVETNTDHEDFLKVEYFIVDDYSETRAEIVKYVRNGDGFFDLKYANWMKLVTKDIAENSKVAFSIECPIKMQEEGIRPLICKKRSTFLIHNTDYKNWLQTKKCDVYEYFIYTYINGKLPIDEMERIQEELSPKQNVFKINLTESSKWIDQCSSSMILKYTSFLIHIVIVINIFYFRSNVID